MTTTPNPATQFNCINSISNSIRNTNININNIDHHNHNHTNKDGETSISAITLIAPTAVAP